MRHKRTPVKHAGLKRILSPKLYERFQELYEQEQEAHGQGRAHDDASSENETMIRQDVNDIDDLDDQEKTIIQERCSQRLDRARRLYEVRGAGMANKKNSVGPQLAPPLALPPFPMADVQVWGVRRKTSAIIDVYYKYLDTKFDSDKRLVDAILARLMIG
jgi:hypothetical protein